MKIELTLMYLKLNSFYVFLSKTRCIKMYNQDNIIVLIILCIFSIIVLKNELLLHEAVIKNDPEAVQRVIKEPLDVNSRNNVSTIIVK